MKKFLALAVCVLMLVGMMSLSTSATRGYTYNSTYGTPVIDGQLDECWQNAVFCQVKYFDSDGWAGDQKDIPLTDYSFAVMNDDEFIYVCAVVYDYSPSEDDLVEFHVDEDFCQMGNNAWEVQSCPVCYQLRIPLAEIDNFSYGMGFMGSGTVNADGSYKDILADMAATKVATTTSLGSCEYRILEFKIAPVTPLGEIKNIGIETSYEDRDPDGEWVNFRRWNTDTLRTADVADGWPEGITDADEEDNWPYCSTATYAPFYIAAAPGADDEPATEEPATEAPADDEPATEAPATEAPADDEPATEAPANKPPKTADAGIVVAAVVMAAAAAVVLNKKH